MSFLCLKTVRFVSYIWIDFDRGAKFMSSKGTILPPHDTVDKEWRHLNFFEHPCYLHACVPRLKTDASSIEMVQVPWARSNSGFTMLFEAFAMALIGEETPVNSVAKTVKEYPNRIWTIFRHWIEKGKCNLNLSNVRRIGVDETSRRKGHLYITQFVDLDTKQTIFVCPGKDSDTFRKFSEWLVEHDSDPLQIEVVAMDMSNAFTSGCMTYVQLVKRRTRGYANVYNFMDMVYYINGGESFHYPLKST